MSLLTDTESLILMYRAHGNADISVTHLNLNRQLDGNLAIGTKQPSYEAPESANSAPLGRIFSLIRESKLQSQVQEQLHILT